MIMSISLKSWVAGAAIGVASMMAASMPGHAGFQSFGQLQMENAPFVEQVKFHKRKPAVRIRDFRKKADRVPARPGKKQVRVRDFRKKADRVPARPGKEQVRVRDFRKKVDRVHARPGS
jgi:hypothetical protein